MLTPMVPLNPNDSYNRPQIPRIQDPWGRHGCPSFAEVAPSKKRPSYSLDDVTNRLVYEDNLDEDIFA